jgi:hypothetical protein
MSALMWMRRAAEGVLHATRDTHRGLRYDDAMRRLTFAVSALGLGLSLLNGCTDRTSLRLVIRSNLAVPSEMDGVIIQMRSSTGATAPVRILELTSNSFPQTLVVRPEASGMSGTVTFTVQGMNDGSIVLQRVVRSPFRTGQVTDVEVELNSDCLNVMCGDGVDCVRGMCETSAMVDAGMPDAFVRPDAFTALPDTNPPDAFMPMVMADAGTDAALDAFTPFDATRDAFSPDAFSPDAFLIPDAFAPDAYRIPDAYTAPDSGIGCVGASCVGTIVISEFTHTGPNGGLDEIVEIYNASERTADIGSMQIFQTSSSGGTRSGRATVPAGTRLLPHAYFLFVGSGYTGSPMADATAWTMGASDAGGAWSIEYMGTVLDRVCWGSAVAAICEGSVLALPPPTAGSYERKASATSTAATMSAGGADELAGNAYDTNNNANDFVLRPTRNPQSMLSPREP